MSGVSEVRPVRGPLLVRFDCTLAFTSPIHVGTGEKDSTTTDAPLLRDGHGEPWLPGSSVRGVLRSYCLREASLLGVGARALDALFGRAGKEGSCRGRLTVLAARSTNQPAVTEVRDHVRMNLSWAAADDGGKFDHEVAYPGNLSTTLLYEGYSNADSELLLLEAALEALRLRALAFGGKTGWGLGVPAAVSIRRTVVDRSEATGIAKYLGGRLPASPTPRADASPERAPKVEYPGVSALPKADDPGPRSWLRLGLVIKLDGPMLVGGQYQASEDRATCQGEGAAQALRRMSDAVYLATPDGTPVLAGSSLRGALQARARQIAKTLGGGVAGLPEMLFGSIRGNDSGSPGRKGLLRVGEGRIVNEIKPIWMDHVGIDRVTGFARKGAKFDVVALQSPKFETDIFVTWDPRFANERAAVALLLFTLRELEEGLLWLGSRTSRGYGCLGSTSIGKLEAAIVARETRGWVRENVTVGAPGSVRSLASTEAKGIVEDSLVAWGEYLEPAVRAGGGGRT